MAGRSSQVAQLAGIRLPIESHILQAFVTEGLKPIINNVVSFGMGHFYISQSDKVALFLVATWTDMHPMLKEVIYRYWSMFSRLVWH